MQPLWDKLDNCTSVQMHVQKPWVWFTHEPAHCFMQLPPTGLQNMVATTIHIQICLSVLPIDWVP